MRSRITVTLISILFILFGNNVKAQLSDADANRLLVLNQRFQELIPDMMSDNESVSARASEKFDAVFDEYLAIIKKDPDLYKMYEEFIKQMEEESRAANERIAEMKRQRESQSNRQTTPRKELPASTEIKGNSSNVRPNPYQQTAPTNTGQRPTTEKVYKDYAAQRLQQGERYKQQHIEFTDYVYDSFTPSPTCSFPTSFNVNIPVSQYFDKELCANSINGQMPWSKPTTFPGTNIQFQYSLLFYCKVPPATLGDQMALVMDDYAFVRIVNKNELITVRGKIEFDYLDSEGVERTSFERFVIEPGKMQEELGMWYLACKFRRVRLVELSCK